MSDIADPTEHPELNLIDFMSVRPTEDPNAFEGLSESYGGVGIYGGHYVGQALSAAFQTVPEPLLAQSFHCYFLRGATPGATLLYRVDSIRDSSRGATRTIACFDGDTQVFHMIASFKTAEVGDEHQTQAPSIPLPQTPENLHADGELPFTFPMAVHGRAEMEWASKTFFESTLGESYPLRVWMRIPDGASLDERDRQIVLGFLSDGPLMFNAILQHGSPMETHRMTSIDHAAWFHRPADPGEWMLFDQRSTNASDGRGMNHGEIFSTDGRLLMTCAQESLLRRIPTES